jgi:hypothetical protein
LDRPFVRDLEFHLFSRPIHPELFETCVLQTVKNADFEIQVRITPSGHVLTFHNPHFWLTEATTVRKQLLPSTGRLIKQRFAGERCEAVKPVPAYQYQMTTQVEQLTDEHFEQAQDEIISSGQKSGLLFRFQRQNRIFLTPVSFMSVQAGRGLISITALHTFPLENTVLKTISLIEKSGENR